MIKIRNKSKENRIVNKRLIVLLFLFFTLFLILIFRGLYLQILNHEIYLTKSKNNIIKENHINPTRGLILDRNNEIIADNRPYYYVTVIPENIPYFKNNKSKSTTDFLDYISSFIEITDKDLIKEKILKSPSFKEIILKEDLTQEELSLLTSNLKYIKGINIASNSVRNYPHKGLFLHVIGYVGKVSKEELQNNDRLLNGLDFVGKFGIEKIFDQHLFGEHGKEVIAINAHGKIIERMQEKRPIKGEDLNLTIDIDLQKEAYKLLGEEKGSIVAIDPNNGDILALVSNPYFDSNKFVNGLTKDEYKEVFLSKNNSPLFNRSIKGVYPPASTIKPFIALAALEGEFINPEKKLWCGPYYQLPGSSRKFLDWKKYGHGHIDIKESIEVSADVYYYRIGRDMGIDYIHDFIINFGFGSKTNIGLQGEVSGLIPSTEWKKRQLKESWYPGETLISSIGQGFMLSTPIQLAMSTASLINGGYVFEPNLVLDKNPIIKRKFNLDDENLKIIKEGMYDVIYGDKGTARNVRKINNFKIAGKTGTSQVFSTHGERKTDEEQEALPKHLKDHALFIGFAPYENPKITIAVIVENGESGSKTAAPIAAKLFNTYINKHYPELSTGDL